MPDRVKQIQQVHQLCHRAWSKQAREAGLSFSEFEYLSAVQAEADRLRYEDIHGQHLQDIVEALGVTKASASTMIAKLEDRELVERFQCKKDARAQHIVLTREGQVKLAGGRRIYESVAEEVEALLNG